MSLAIGIAALTISMAASPPARAENHGVVSTYDKAAYDGALREFQALARGDDTAAQFYLALMFKDGLGVEADPMVVLGWSICVAGPGGHAGSDAANWTEQLSSSPNDASTSAAQVRALRCRAMAAPPPTRAAYRAAVSANDERGHDAALREVQALSRQGSTVTQYYLALMFEGSLGVEEDPMVALGWFTCAAGRGGQVGTGAANRIEQLSSIQDDATSSATQARMQSCRVAQGSERPEFSETPKPADYGIFSSLEGFDATLEKLFAGSSQAEPTTRNRGISLDWNSTSAPPKSSSGSFFATPNRGSVWSKAFFSPADGTIYGSQKIAWEIGANDLYRDLRSLAQNDSRIVLGILAALWWFLIGKVLFSFNRALVSVFRLFGVK